MRQALRIAAPPLLAALLFSAVASSHARISTRLSWDGDVQRIVAARCASCHARPRSGVDLQLTIPDLSTYAKARPWARAIREAVFEGHGYAASNGGALTPFERELLVAWVDGGAPEKPKFNPVDFPRLPPAYIRIASPDPLATLDAYHARLGGTRAIVPGLGLALRTPSELIVIDREASPEERLIARGTIVSSLAAHLASLPASAPRVRISDTAYAIGPLAEPRTEVAEVEPEGPDRFWCPMHPDVRRPHAGTCPRCGMPLAEMPALSLDAFSLEIVNVTREAGGVSLNLRVTRGAAKQPVTSFLTMHERPFHLFVVDERLEFFSHVHPEIRADELNVRLSVPAKGGYRLIADFVPVDAYPQLRMTSLNVTNGTFQPSNLPTTVTGALNAMALLAGRISRVTFALRDRETGAAPMNLEPYLGASAHLFVIDRELHDPMHAHPIDLSMGGLASPAFDIRFPRAGEYVMWLQVQRAGRVETLRFTAEVSN